MQEKYATLKFKFAITKAIIFLYLKITAAFCIKILMLNLNSADGWSIAYMIQFHTSYLLINLVDNIAPWW